MSPLLILVVAFVAILAIGFLYEVFIKLPPADRNEWVQRAAHAALVAENIAVGALGSLTPEQEDALVKRINTYLSLHSVGFRVNRLELEVVLAELRLLLPKL